MGCRGLRDEPNRHGPQFRVAQQALIAEGAAEELAETFKALADPTRARIISALSATELCVGDLAELLGMTLSAVSYQLRLLRQLRVARARRDGRRIYYVLDDEHIATIYRCGLDHIHHD